VFVLIDIATREALHWDVTDHPTAEWTVQQFRDGVPPDVPYQFVVHDRDAVFAPAVTTYSGPCRSGRCGRLRARRRRMRIVNA
jgi:putative transposase